MLTAAALHTALNPRPFRYFDSVPSTQDIAREWALADPDLPSGAVVIADHQTAGRGRQGREWLSQPGSSLMCSIVLRPDPTPDHLPRVTMIGGVAVHEILEPLLANRVALKWPNDIHADGRKLCGVLAEATWIGDQLAAVILGIGLNVRCDFTGTDLASTATCLEAAGGWPVHRRNLLVVLLARVDHWAKRIGDPALLAAWQERLGTLGKRVRVYTDTSNPDSPFFTGIAESVDDNGGLVVRLDSGEQRIVYAADVGLREQ